MAESVVHMAVVVVVLGWVSGVGASSSGDVGLCNPHGNAGCATWGTGRLDCTESTHGVMEWAARPTRTAMYSVTEAHSSDAYIPGTIITLKVEVHGYDWKYRGLLMDAVDSSNTTVGSFAFPSLDNALFWQPPNCPQALIHTNADPKPFVVHVQYNAPAAGTGAITFRTLLKKGPANEGEFHYPATDLVLQEAMASMPVAVSLAPAGVSCSDHCATVAAGSECDGESLRIAGLNAENFSAVVSPFFSCTSTPVSTCSAVAPGVDASGECVYRADPAACPTAPTNPCATVAILNCGASDPTVQRLCPCTTPTTTSPAGTRLRRDTTSGAAGVSAAQSVAPSLVIAGSLFMGGASRPTLAAGLLTAMLSWAAPADAHNWMHTPARALNEASTTAPCRGRKASDTHAQVGPGQAFVIKWATGHTRQPSYWVTVHSSNEHRLRARNFTAMVNDYLANAPAGSNTATDPRYQRYHGISSRDMRSFRTHAPQNPNIYGQEIMPNDPNFLNHSRVPTVFQYNFTDAVLQNDHRTSYASAKYPWIESAYKYMHVDNRARDWDGVRVTIPGRQGPGHYIVHWRWNGYYDCVDADYFDDRSVSNPDGVVTGGHTWNKIDHCQYQTPFRQTLSQCVPANAGAKACKDAIAGVAGVNAQTRLGINVIPLNNPSEVSFPNQSNIPWGNRKCANSAWTAIPGATSENPLSGFANSLGTGTAGRQCSSTSFRGTYTARQAMFRCQAVSTCIGLVGVKPMVTSDLTDGGKYTWFGCQTSIIANSSMLSIGYTKPTQYRSSPTVTAPTWVRRISFQPANTPGMAMPAGWVADVGSVYGNRSGANMYGWRCAMPQRDSGRRVGFRGGPGMNVATFTSNRRLSVPPTLDNTWAQNLLTSVCSDNNLNEWEMAVPNGVYRVTTGHAVPNYGGNVTNPTIGSYANFRIQGCVVEGTAIDRFVAVTRSTSTTMRAVTVLVSDGAITLSSVRGSLGCNVVNTITVERVGTTYPPTWVPASGAGGAWWQKQIVDTARVGLVTVNPTPGRASRYSDSDCRYRMMLEGDRCQPNTPLGNFTAADQGFVVSVADQPCTATGCSGGTICRRVTTVDRSTACGVCTGNTNPQNYDVNCRGATGRYVRVHLPGSGRVLPADVSVNYVKPVAAAEDDLVCYAVQARAQTETLPEFVVAKDPRDPVFYSTCFVRETAVQWLAPPGGNPVPETPRFRYGDICIDCASYRANQLPTNVSMLVPPFWRTTDTCVDCGAVPLGDPTLVCSGNVAADEAMPSDVNGSSPASGGDGGSAAGIAIGGILALVATVVIAVLVHRNRQSTAAGRYIASQHDKVQIENPVYSVEPAPAVSRATIDRSRPVQIVDSIPSPAGSRSNSISDEDKLVIKGSMASDSAVAQLAQLVEPVRPPLPARQPPPLPPTAAARPAMPSRPAPKPRVAETPSAVTQAGPKSVAIQPQWEVVVGKEDKSISFYDAVGDTVQWESPFAPCWTAELDDELNVFWVNSETGESQWEVPEENSSV